MQRGTGGLKTLREFAYAYMRKRPRISNLTPYLQTEVPRQDADVFCKADYCLTCTDNYKFLAKLQFDIEICKQALATAQYRPVSWLWL